MLLHDFFPFAVSVNSDEGVKSVKCSVEEDALVSIERDADYVHHQPYPPLLNPFSCQHPHTDDGQRRGEAVPPGDGAVCA